MMRAAFANAVLKAHLGAQAMDMHGAAVCVHTSVRMPKRAVRVAAPVRHGTNTRKLHRLLNIKGSCCYRLLAPVCAAHPVSSIH
eukprot:4368621-Pleurochrysis_carterae.AAC.2